MKNRKAEKRKNIVRFIRLAGAVSLTGLCFLHGGSRVSAGIMENVFDEHYYADKYPDLKEAHGYDREALWQHFADHGLSEGRVMNDFIDVFTYRDTYRDLNEAFGDDWDAYVYHYLTSGAEEGRLAGGRFDALDYADIEPELQKLLEEYGGDDEPDEQDAFPLPEGFWEQAIAKGSYGAQWRLDQVDTPQLRSFEEIMLRLNELGQEDELIAQIYGSYFVYPENMLQALVNNPEMAGFVSGYTVNTASASGGFSEDELALKFPLFLQWDPRWGYVQYGDNSNIGLSGCGPTCLSMALYYLTGNAGITPDSVAAYSMASGYYVPGAGTAWKLLTDLPEKYGVKVSEPMWSEQTLEAALDQGKIVICSMRPGDFTAGGHFIVIYGYDEEGFMINDPNCVARSMRHWTYGEIAAQIKHVWVLEGQAAPDVPSDC